MGSPELTNDVIEGYFRYQRYLAEETRRLVRDHQPIPRGVPDEFSPLFEWLVDSSSRPGPDGTELAWPVVLALIASAPDDQALMFIGSSALEDLLDAAGDDFAERVEERYSVDPRFRTALGAVWPSETVPAAVQQRIRMAREGTAPPPK